MNLHWSWCIVLLISKRIQLAKILFRTIFSVFISEIRYGFIFCLIFVRFLCLYDARVRGKKWDSVLFLYGLEKCFINQKDHLFYRFWGWFWKFSLVPSCYWFRLEASRLQPAGLPPVLIKIYWNTVMLTSL